MQTATRANLKRAASHPRAILLAALLVAASAAPSRAFLFEPYFDEWDTYVPPFEHYVKWWPADIPVPFQICGVYDEPSIALDGEFDAVRDAFQNWEDVEGASLTFQDNGLTSNSSECGYVGDGLNTTTFTDPNDDLPSGVLGSAMTWMDPWCTNPILTNGIEFCPIVESDIVYNDGIDFIRNSDIALGCSNQFDLDAVATHEIGHLLGLTHPPGGPTSPSTPPSPQSDPPEEATMFWSLTACDDSKLSLHQDDIDGVSFLYPQECKAPQFTIAPDPAEQCVLGSVSFTPTLVQPGEGTFEYTWDFGDGTPPVVRTTLAAESHTFGTGGDFTVTCTARWTADPDNCFSDATTAVTIAEPPSLHIDPIPTACEGSPVTLAAVLDDAGHGTYTYTWDFGDGDSQGVSDPTEAVQHTYPAGQDTFTATLSAAHASLSGCDSEAQAQVTFDRPPTFSVKLGEQTCPGHPLEMWGEVTDYGKGDYAWVWDFGDATPVQEVSDPTVPIEHTYGTAGPFTLTLKAENQAVPSCDGTAVKTVTLNNDQPPAFSIAAAQTGCADDPVSLSATVTDWGTGTWLWEWEFGDATPNQGVSDPTVPVLHTYADVGPYTAVLHATNQSAPTCETSASSVFQLNDDLPPVLTVHESQTGCLTAPVTLWADVSDPGTGSWTFFWEFGDATPNQAVSDPEQPVSHLYATAGPYTAAIHAVNAAVPTCEAVYTLTFSLVGDQPPSYSVAAAQTGCADDPVSLSATVTDWGAGTWLWEWEFGDATPNQAVADPTVPVDHVYATSGPFTAVLHAVSQALPGCTTEASVTFELNDDRPPAYTVGMTQTGCADDPVSLSATVTDWGAGTWLWEWEFGDATPNQGVSDPTAPVAHAYADAGPHTAVLHARSQAAPTCETTASSTFRLNDDRAPVLAVRQVQMDCITAPVTLWANVTDPGTGSWTFFWEFGDATPNQAVSDPRSSVGHVYGTAGPYTAALHATNASVPACEAVFTSTFSLVADLPPSYTVTATQTGCADDPVSLRAAVTDWGAGTWLWEWEFGDATPNQGVANPTVPVLHTYAGPGPFTAVLHAASQALPGCRADEPAVFRVNDDRPPAYTLGFSQAGCAADPVSLWAVVSDWGTGTWLWEWDFGDGTPTQGVSDPSAPVQHAYAATGPYSPVLRARNGVVPACETTATRVVTLVGNTPPSFALRLTLTGCAGAPARLVADVSGWGTGIWLWEWDFGDGTPAQGVSDPTVPVDHAYASAGPYTAVLHARDQASPGCERAASIPVLLNNDRLPSFTVLAEASVCSGTPATLSANIADPGTGQWLWEWDFGDLSPVQQVADPLTPVQHVYAAEGEYDAVLRAVNQAVPLCETSVPQRVSVTDDDLPAVPVGNRLTLWRESRDLVLHWEPIDLRFYNVHATDDPGLLGDSPSGIGAAALLASPSGVEDLRLPGMVDGPEVLLFLEVHGRASCSGRSVFP